MQGGGGLSGIPTQDVSGFAAMGGNPSTLATPYVPIQNLGVPSTGPTTSSILGSIASGLQSAGKSASQGQTPIPQFQLPQGLAQGIGYQPYQPSPIPQTQVNPLPQVDPMYGVTPGQWGGGGGIGIGGPAARPAQPPGYDIMQLFQRLLG